MLSVHLQRTNQGSWSTGEVAAAVPLVVGGGGDVQRVLWSGPRQRVVVAVVGDDGRRRGEVDEIRVPVLRRRHRGRGGLCRRG